VSSNNCTHPTAGLSARANNLYLGNIAAQQAYRKQGFKVLDEKRDLYFEAETGSPGMARRVRDL